MVLAPRSLTAASPIVLSSPLCLSSTPVCVCVCVCVCVRVCVCACVCVSRRTLLTVVRRLGERVVRLRGRLVVGGSLWHLRKVLSVLGLRDEAGGLRSCPHLHCVSTGLVLALLVAVVLTIHHLRWRGRSQSTAPDSLPLSRGTACM